MPKFPLTQIFAYGNISMCSFKSQFFFYFDRIHYCDVPYTKCILITIELTALSKEETP